MKKWRILGALLACMLIPWSGGFAQTESQEGIPAFTPEEIQQIKDAIKRGQLGTTGAEKPPLRPGGPARGPIPSKTPLDPTGVEPKGKKLEELSKPRDLGDKYGSTMEGSGKLIYARPFVASPKAILGGYYDFEYINRANRGPSFFDQHRLVPFIYGDVSDNVKFAAEIEFEHGAQDRDGGADIKVEFAVADYLINEPLNLRAGILLLPLGKFNLLHDSPLRDLTIRPLVNQRIIPTTLHQPGAGIYGTFYPTELAQVNYELYVTSGFTNAFSGGNAPGDVSNITNTNGIRSARTNDTGFDNNNGKAVVGRLAVSPFLGVEIGGSGFFGNYAPEGVNRPLSIWAVDWTFQRGPFELIGESAWAFIKDNNETVSGMPIPMNMRNPQRMHGYYIQLNYHFLPQWLTRLAPNHFRQEVSTLTAVVRWNQISLGQDLPNTELGRKLGRQQRLEVGMNFRPTEDTVFKVNWEYDPETRDGTQRIQDNGFIASVATYF